MQPITKGKSKGIEDVALTESGLQQTLIAVAFHAQGHRPKCKCDWCLTGASIQATLARPDLYHGGHCKKDCHHVRSSYLVS